MRTAIQKSFVPTELRFMIYAFINILRLTAQKIKTNYNLARAHKTRRML